MNTIVWEVECLSCVKVRRHCKKCGGKSEFVSSGLFRVNANKKKLDVWLVYRCDICGTSWNLPVHERAKPDSLPDGALAGYLKNDPALARQCAMDAALLARCGCETRTPEVVITGEDVPKGRPVQLMMKSAAPLGLRLDKLLRQKLGLSAKALKALLGSGGIRLANGQDVHRQKLGYRAHLVVHLPAQAAAGDEDETPRRCGAAGGNPCRVIVGGQGRTKSPRLYSAGFSKGVSHWCEEESCAKGRLRLPSFC